jgi:hypothetical protein
MASTTTSEFINKLMNLTDGYLSAYQFQSLIKKGILKTKHNGLKVKLN